MQNRFLTEVTGDSGSVWSLPKQLLIKNNLHHGDHVTLRSGGTKCTVLVKESKLDSVAKVGLSKEALAALHLPAGLSLQIKNDNNGTFSLGPIIGILTFPGHIPHRLGFYSSYAACNTNGGLLYVFRGRDVNTEKNTVTGYYFDYNQRRWKQGEFPYPDSVYDRCYPNPYIVHMWLEKIIGPNRIFNKKTMIDKFQFWKALRNDPFLRDHTPKTRLFLKTDDFTIYLDKYKQVFLKPTNGMKGWGIVVATKKNNGFIKCLYTNKQGKSTEKILQSPDEIWPLLITAVGRKRPYIIQQGIDRMHYKGGPFSIRTWAMKNKQGQWIIPGMFAKGSLGEGFLTNFTAGAKLIPLPDLLTDVLPRLPYTKSQLYELLFKLSLNTAKALDREYGPLGELGFDIVFDREGSLWVIEANGNPGNIPIFMQKEYPLWPHLIFQYPMDYAAYLAGFSA